jgi:hypothetical protein
LSPLSLTLPLPPSLFLSLLSTLFSFLSSLSYLSPIFFLSSLSPFSLLSPLSSSVYSNICLLSPALPLSSSLAPTLSLSLPLSLSLFPLVKMAKNETNYNAKLVLVFGRFVTSNKNYFSFKNFAIFKIKFAAYMVKHFTFVTYDAGKIS